MESKHITTPDKSKSLATSQVASSTARDSTTKKPVLRTKNAVGSAAVRAPKITSAEEVSRDSVIELSPKKFTTPEIESAESHKKPAFTSKLLKGLTSLLVGFIGGLLALWIFGPSQEGSGVVTVDKSGGSNLQEGSTVADLAEAVTPSVVSVSISQEVDSFFGTQTQQGSGTGVILTETGLILTNKHVVPEGIDAVSIFLSDGTQYDDVEVVARDQFNDIAFLRIKNAEGLSPVTLGDSSQVRVGDSVIAIGNALGEFSSSVTAGIISGVGRPVVASDGAGDVSSLQNLFQTDTAINPGNSGGPLFDLNGRVIGINVAVADAENIGFSIPVNDVLPLIASVQENGRIVRPYLGVRYQSLTPQISAQLNVGVDQGALLIGDEQASAVIPGSPADDAGLRVDDVIISIDNQDISPSTSITEIISNFSIGDQLVLDVLRDGERIQVDITLEEAPASL